MLSGWAIVTIGAIYAINIGLARKGMYMARTPMTSWPLAYHKPAIHTVLRVAHWSLFLVTLVLLFVDWRVPVILLPASWIVGRLFEVIADWFVILPLAFMDRGSTRH